ncbi:MAG: hypothetical protein QMD22_02745 [archaeon]|nr:hypothetical protein [archaeon]
MDYLSDEAYVRYKAKIEAAVVRVFEKQGIIKKELCDEIVAATSSITVEGVCEEDIDKIVAELYGITDEELDEVKKTLGGLKGEEASKKE